MSIRFPHPISTIYSPPFPTFLFSPCATPSPHPFRLCLHWGGSSCCQWPFFHVTGLVLGVSGLPSSCFLKPCQVPGLLGAQGRNSPGAAKGLPSPCYSLLSQKPAVVTQARGIMPTGPFSVGGCLKLKSFKILYRFSSLAST